MAKLTNVELLNELRTIASASYTDRIPVATKNNIKQIATSVTTYPTVKNELVELMINVVGKSMFFTKLYTNPFKFFKKGNLEYGKTIQGIFTDLIKAKDFSENFGDSQVSSLIGTEKATHVKPEYYSENFRNKYKLTISNEQLKGAFYSESGLNDLINQMLMTPLNSAETDEYLMIKQALCNLKLKEVNIVDYDKLSENEQAKKLTKTIKTYVNKFKFMSNEYNQSGVYTFTDNKNVCVIVTPETKANIDVELLSSSFNLSKAEIEERLVMVDSFTKEGSGKVEEDNDTLCIVCDMDLIQFYETENTSETFRNPDRLENNTFVHRWGIIAGCGFANAIKIKKTTTVTP